MTTLRNLWKRDMLYMAVYEEVSGVGSQCLELPVVLCIAWSQQVHLGKALDTRKGGREEAFSAAYLNA